LEIVYQGVGMVRLSRVSPVGVPVHIIQLGKNR